MQVRHLTNGAVRILLTDRELQRFCADFFALRENDPKTASVLRRILKTACPETLLGTGQHLLVEAAPVDGGCLLLITPKKREEGILCLRVSSAAAMKRLLTAAEHLLRNGAQNAAVYRLGEQYYLLLYGAPFPASAIAALCEFAVDIHGDRLTVARLLEYGTPLAVGGALSRFTVPEYGG